MRAWMSGGGTAGHVYPALTVAGHLAAEHDDVLFVGTPDGLEARLVPEAGVAFRGAARERLRPLAAVDAADLLGADRCVSTVHGVALAGRATRPDVVIGFGGYVSIPVGLAAVLRGVPLVLHEQNSVPGLANKVLSRWATRGRRHVRGVGGAARAPRAGGGHRQPGAPRGPRRPTGRAAARRSSLPDDAAPCCSCSAAAAARATSTRRSSRCATGCWRYRKLRVVHVAGHARGRHRPRGARRGRRRRRAADGRCSTTSTTWARRSPRPTSSSRVRARPRSRRSRPSGCRRCSCRTRTRPTTTRRRTPPRWSRTAQRNSSPTTSSTGNASVTSSSGCSATRKRRATMSDASRTLGQARRGAAARAARALAAGFDAKPNPDRPTEDSVV